MKKKEKLKDSISFRSNISNKNLLQNVTNIIFPGNSSTNKQIDPGGSAGTFNETTATRDYQTGVPVESSDLVIVTYLDPGGIREGTI